VGVKIINPLKSMGKEAFLMFQPKEIKMNEKGSFLDVSTKTCKDKR